MSVSRPSTAGSQQIVRGGLTPTQMRRLCGAALRPKSARWISSADREIMSAPIGTFQDAAACRGKPTSCFGTGERFDAARSGVSHFGESCGPERGPGYDISRAEQATQHQRRAGVRYAPTTSGREQHGRPLELPVEGGEPDFMPKSTFAREAARSSRGRSSAMGTAGRFSETGGLAGMGNKSYITPSATAGAAMQDIRRWPPTDATVRVGRITVPSSRARSERCAPAASPRGRILRSPRPPPLRTNRTRCVPHLVLIGHAVSLTPN